MKTSPAIRVHRVLKQAHEINVNQPRISLLVWAQVFGLPNKEGTNNVGPELEDLVMQRLRDIREEVAEIERSVGGTEFADAFAPLAATVRMLTATSQANLDWNQVKTNFLRSDFLVGWYWASLSLPSEDIQISENALAELLAEIANLEEAAEGDGVPTDLRRMARRYAMELRDAVDRYPIRGAGPLQAAVSKTLGDVIRDQDQLQAAAASAPKQSLGVFSTLQRVWSKAAEFCGDVDKLRKGYELATLAYEKALPLLQHLPKS